MGGYFYTCSNRVKHQSLSGSRFGFGGRSIFLSAIERMSPAIESNHA